MRTLLLALLTAPLLTSPVLAQANDTPAAVKKPSWVDSTNWSAITTSYLIVPDGQVGPILNKPFSAIEVRYTPHTNPDHTHNDRLDKNKLYRDRHGRMRMQGSEVILLFDPTIDKTYTLHRQEKEYEQAQAIYRTPSKTFPTEIAVFGETGYAAHVQATEPVREVVVQHMWGAFSGTFTPTNHVDTVELGTETINGLICKGTRVTLTIPANPGGNDIHIVYERWYSDDLQILVKSINDDPRFGVSTYELKEITRAEPDSSLFKLPEGYTQSARSDWINWITKE